MKGTVIKIESEWKVKAKRYTPHAGVSKKGTGPGVGKIFYTEEIYTLNSDDIYLVKEGDEIDFFIDHCTPMGTGLGQEQYSNTIQQYYGVTARITKSRDSKFSVLTESGYIGDELQTHQKSQSLFSDEEVNSFNERQKLGVFHPYTCCSFDGCDRSLHNDGILVATNDALVCPCGKYKQYWKH